MKARRSWTYEENQTLCDKAKLQYKAGPSFIILRHEAEFTFMGSKYRSRQTLENYRI